MHSHRLVLARYTKRTTFITAKCRLSDKQSLKTTSESIHKSLGIDATGQKIVRVLDQTEVDPRVYALRNKLLYTDYLHQHLQIFSYVRRVQATKSYFMTKAAKERERQQKFLPSVLLSDSMETEAKRDNDNRNFISGQVDQKWSSLDETYEAVYRNRFKKTKYIINKYGVRFKDYKAMDSGDLPKCWMSDYEQFDENAFDTSDSNIYGTPNINVAVSNVQCTGCGAILHCKDPTIPGYLPSEIFLKIEKPHAGVAVCQRCHFLKVYNVALDVKVCPEQYANMLCNLKEKECTILLIVDATDLSCSIWPQLSNIIHERSKLVVIVNKIDLLPVDSSLFFRHVTQQVKNAVVCRGGLASEEQIATVQLISAKTGFGIERLVSFLLMETPGANNSYLVGSTNVGKSSVFNRLLESDYCDINAENFIDRVTTSPWPGTTLNMLKFPIQQLSKNLSAARKKRIKDQSALPTQIMITKRVRRPEHGNIQHAILEEDVGRTLKVNHLEKGYGVKGTFEATRPDRRSRRSLAKLHVDTWCHDTPGVHTPDQILDLLTIDELNALTPRWILSPKSFILRLGTTMFLAGIGRMDYISREGNDAENDFKRDYARCTLFTSDLLPLTICHTSDADEVYEKLLETEAFVIPSNDPERLQAWPKLKSKMLEVTGTGLNLSSSDITFSSAGWVAIALAEGDTGRFRVWTPEGRGIHLRSPALLRKSISLRGTLVHGTPVYSKGRQVYFGRLATT